MSFESFGSQITNSELTNSQLSIASQLLDEVYDTDASVHDEDEQGPPSGPKKSRRFCFTDYEEIEDRANAADLAVRSGTTCLYVCFQHEIAPTTGKRHCQGYAEFKSPTRWTRLRTLGIVSDTCHIEPANGSSQQNRRYCSKDETRDPDDAFFEVGTIQNSPGVGGKRSDLDRVARALADGRSELDILDTWGSTYIRYCRGIKSAIRLREEHSIQPIRKITVSLYVGPSGTSKSYEAYKRACALPGGPKDVYVWIMSNNRTGFPRYAGQSVLILEDLGQDTSKVFPYQFLLRVLDEYPMCVNTFCDIAMARWSRIYITSNYMPYDWYPRLRADALQPLLRRIHSIERFDIVYRPPVVLQPDTSDEPEEEQTGDADSADEASFDIEFRGRGWTVVNRPSDMDAR